MPATSGIIQSKLQPSRIGSDFVIRRRLLDAIGDCTKRKVTLLSAPAGYGKTVFLLQLIDSLSVPVVWYQLDEFDNDLSVFLEYIIEGVRRRYEGFGAAALALLRQTKDVEAESQRILASLLNDLGSVCRNGLVIVIDDYHLITEAAIHNLLERLIVYLPRGIHLVLSGRSVPILRLTRLKIEGSLLEIGHRELQFTKDEIAEFFGKQGDQLAPEAVLALEEETLGWPVALRLAEITFRDQALHDKVRAARSFATRQEIYAYLASEVFDTLSEEDKAFLTATSVLDVVTPSLCDRLLGRTDSADVLRSLVSRRLFVAPIEGEEEAYRYHALLRYYLQTRLGDRRDEMFNLAGECYLSSGMSDRAVESFLNSRNYPRAAVAIGSAASRLLRHGRWQTVLRWLQVFPPDQIRTDPRIALFHGTVIRHSGSLDEAEKLIDLAVDLFRAAEDTVGEAQALIQKGSVLRSRGRFKESVELIERALSFLGEGSRLDLDASLELATDVCLQGEFDASLRLLQRHLALAERDGDRYAISRILEKQSDVCYQKGDYALAVEAYQRAGEASPEPLAENEIPAIYREWGDLDAALECAKEALSEKERRGILKAIPYSHHQIGSILMEMGDLEGAEAQFRRAISLTRQYGGERFCEVLSSCFLARCIGMKGNWREATDVALNAIKVGNPLSPYILGLCKGTAGGLLLMSGRFDEGYEMLVEATRVFERLGSKQPLSKGQVFLALADLSRGDRESARVRITQSLTLAARENYLQSYVTYGVLIGPVLAMAVEDGVEEEFVHEILKRIGNPIVPALKPLLNSKDPLVRKRGVSALSSVNTPEALEAIRPLLSDDHEEVQDLAVSVLQTASLARVKHEPQRWGKAKRVSAVTRALRDAAEPASGRVYARCLGPFRLLGQNATEVEWRTTKARDMVAYLIHHEGVPVAKDRILEDLWPGVDPEQASTLFHTSLYQARKSLRDAGVPSDAIVYSGGQYRLVEGVIDSDRSLLSRLEVADGLSDLAAVVAEVDGDYMENLDYEWLSAERQRVEFLYMQAVERLARLYSQAGDHAQAAHCLRLLIHKNPLLEEVHCLLMSTYAAMGDRLAVIQQYETLKDVLDRELGVNPAAKTRALYYRLCGQQDDVPPSRDGQHR